MIGKVVNGVEPQRQRLDPRARSTPARLERRQLHALPRDLQREASGRLRMTAMLLAGLWLAAAATRHLVLILLGTSPGGMSRLGVIDWMAGMIILASLALFVYLKKPDRDARFVLDLGLVYLVLTAFTMAVTINWAPVPSHTSVLPMISPIGPIMLMFAAIVPNTPMRTTVAGLIAVSMNPLSMLVARARGTWDFGPASNAFLMHLPDYVLVGVAAAISHIVTRLSQHVATARAMGSYELGELLGRGGMGEVYRATHRLLARPAAIKLIRPERLGGGTPEAMTALTRFKREAQVAASLRSPHTVELYDFGIAEDQTFYLVMELLEGLDLESLVVEKGPLPASRVIYILRQVCESLEEAHAAGLVHRDIKPANLHLGRLGLRHDFVKVLDFGIVKSVGTTGVTQTQATISGLALGTPAYMAPEMALGQPFDGRADIYALGCVAYYLLSGLLVFEAKQPMQLLLKRVEEDPPRLSSRTEEKVPPELERLVMACLARTPAHRPTAADLSRALAEVPIAPWTEADAAKWWQVNGFAGRSGRSEVTTPLPLR